MSKAPLLAAAAGVEQVPVADTDIVEAVEVFDDIGNTTHCSNCDHPGSLHGDTADGDNTGTCNAVGCDCGAMVAAAAPAKVAATMTFTSVDGVDLLSAETFEMLDPDLQRDLVFSAWQAGRFDSVLLVEHEPLDTTPATRPDVAIVPAAEPDGIGPGMRWNATITLEGTPTDDGRIFAPNAVTWRELPLSLGAMVDTPHADTVTASPVIGRIDRIWREGSLIQAEGVFDASDAGANIARMVGDGTLRGVSVDIAIAKMEIAYRSDILDENGAWKGGDSPAEGDGPNMIDILFGEPEGELMFVVWEGVIGAVTICPFPAFADARIEVASSLVASPNPMVWTLTQQAGFMVYRGTAAEQASLVAAALTAAAPVSPPADWFANPELEELTALTVCDDGLLFGHAAAWDVCHIGIPGVCTTAPTSTSGYAYFHLKEVECEDGERVSCGTITLDTGHADRRLARADATRHYDNTGTAVADVVCGEDAFGIWFSGAIRPGVDEETLRTLRGAVLSGDWRNVNGHLEFVALLAVNVPGFPVPRTRAMVASGDEGPTVLALVAAGIHAGDEAISRAEQAKFDALADVAAGAFAELAEQAQQAAVDEAS